MPSCGWVKASNFKNSQNRAAYLYMLTPRGLAGKAQLALAYLQQRMREYDDLRNELERIETRRAADGNTGVT